MTFIATLTLNEQDANRLADAIADDEMFAGIVVDAVERTADVWDLTAYFETEPGATARKRLRMIAKDVLARDPGAFAVTELAETDWIAKSLEGLKPVRAGRFLVHGSHDRGKRVENLINIEIEAGLAFGTGHHGTTAGCLIAVDRIGRRRRFRNVLDLGTGSGVLAIAVAKAWGVPVLATDIDPQAVRVARDNAKANGVWSRMEAVTATGFQHPSFARRAPFDLILANILAKPLASLSRELVGHLAPGGLTVLSGLLPSQQGQIVAAYRDKGLRLASASVLNDWLTLVMEKRL